MVDLERYRQYLKEHLSPKRFAHSVNVSLASKELAERFGGVAPEQAEFAGLVHDICKEEPEEVQYALVMQSKLDVCEEEKQAFKVWHGIAGAQLLQEQFGVTDIDILLAVRYHTIGHAGMSVLERIVYLADMISAERDYPDVDTMRKKTKEGLEMGMCYALKISIQKLLKKEALIPHHTAEAYNEYLSWLHQQEG